MQVIKKLLEEHNKTLDSIRWIGTPNQKVELKTFLELPEESLLWWMPYSILPNNTVIVGDDWYIQMIKCEGAAAIEYKEGKYAVTGV